MGERSVKALAAAVEDERVALWRELLANVAVDGGIDGGEKEEEEEEEKATMVAETKRWSSGGGIDSRHWPTVQEIEI